MKTESPPLGQCSGGRGGQSRPGRWVSWIMMMVMAGLVAFWGTRLAVFSKPVCPLVGVLGEGSHLKAELGLDGPQAAQIQALERGLAAQLSGQCGRYCAMRAELGAALMDEGTNAAVDARRLVGQMCDLQSAAELATLEHIRKVNAVLTPGQRKKFLSGLTQCLCGEGGLCAGGCMGEGKP